MSASVRPGIVLADRYRLLEKKPSPDSASSWLARDLTTGYELGVKVVDMDVLEPDNPRSDALATYADRSRIPPRVLVTPPYVLLIDERGRRGRRRSRRRDDEEPPMSSRARILAAVAALAVLVFCGGAGWLIATSVFGRGGQNVAVPSLSAARVSTSDWAGGALRPTSAEAWSAVRYPDNADDAGRAIDANPATRWYTDTYRTAFGTPDNGIGLLIGFDEPVDIDEVWIASDAVGTVVEIRTPPESDDGFDSTRVIGTGVLKQGTTHIPIEPATRARSVLVWISELAATDSGYESWIGEVGATDTAR
ncbi:hypothetical protein [Rhodococcoides kyotonense]|uniref:Uncharacterized protein n=1 Tax=Rhodococcoides kyotonense TaxID=398843 RepID=A0A239LJW9_9NOCA|nr:hypothetical protein [Rhodococcus kyotonensis]SNT30761.1 hypothetical protein SAMN05421642_113111 [Rhodococcus kyotonensis]